MSEIIVENINLELINTDKAQARLRELIDGAESTYVDCIHNIIFTQLQLDDLCKDELELDGSDELAQKSHKATRDSSETKLRSNKGWLLQYEKAIPYLKSLLKK